jgi:hypothetical protein
MANAVPATARKLFLDGDIDLLNDTIKAVLVKSSSYTYSSAHDYLDDVTAAGRVATVTLSSKTTTGGAFDSADPTFTAVASGSTVTGLWIYKDSGTESTSPLIAWFDTQASSSAISTATSGADITISVSASGWFTV